MVLWDGQEMAINGSLSGPFLKPTGTLSLQGESPSGCSRGGPFTQSLRAPSLSTCLSQVLFQVLGIHWEIRWPRSPPSGRQAVSRDTY